MPTLAEQFGLSETEAQGIPDQPEQNLTETFRFREQNRGTPGGGLSGGLVGEFSRGLDTGTDSLQMSVHGVFAMAGREFGIKSLQDFGEQGVRINQQQLEFAPEPTISSISEIEDTGDFFRFAANQLGQATPSLASTVAGGGVGGAVVKKVVENRLRSAAFNQTVKKLTANGFSREAAQDATQRILTSRAGQDLLIKSVTAGQTRQQVLNTAFSRGALSSAAAVGGVPQAGQIDIELQEAGVPGGDSALTAILGGTLGGALEALPALRLLDKMFPGVDRKVSQSFVKDLAVGMGQQSALEGSTELAQEFIQLAALAFHDPTFDPFSEESRGRMLDAFAAGALVGGVTGGGATLTGRGTPKAPEFTKRVNKRAKTILDQWSGKDAIDEVIPQVDEVADNTIFQEVRDRMSKAASDILDPIVNSVRNAGQEAIDLIDSQFEGGMNAEAERLSSTIKEAHSNFVTEHKVILDRVTKFVGESTQKVSESAAQIKDPQKRQAFINEQTQRIKDEVKKVSDIISRNAKRAKDNLSRTVDESDINLEDGFAEVNPTQFVFGKNNSGGRDSNIDLFNPPEGEVQGFSTRKGARNLLGRLRERFPSATDSTFAIREQDDGSFVVELNDPASSEALVEDDRVTRALERARLSARRHRNDARKVSLTRPDGKKTIVDFPSLVFAARDLVDVTTHNQGVLTILQRLGERNLLNNEEIQEISERFLKRSDTQLQRLSEADRDFDALPPGIKKDINKRVNEQLNDEGLKGDERAEKRQELLQEELDTLDREGIDDTEQQGEEARFIEEGQGRDLESEDDQARASRSKRPFSKKGQSFSEEVQDTFNKKDNLKVYLPGASEKLNRAVHDLADFVQTKLGVKSEIRIINKEGASRMVKAGHSHANNLGEFDLAGLGRAITVEEDGKRVVYVMLDTNNLSSVGVPTVLMHELGHVIHNETWQSLSEDGQTELWNAFVKELNSGNYGDTRVRRRKGEPAKPDFVEFKEWMADQLVAWSNRRSEPRNAVEKFFKDVSEKIQKLYDFLTKNPDRFLSLDQSYGDFVDALARRVADPGTDSRFFSNEAQNRFFEIPVLNVDDISIAQVIPQARRQEIQRRFESRYPTIARRAALIRNWIYNAYSLMAAPSNSVMLDIAKRVPEARKLVRIFGREEHGRAKRSKNYHQRVTLMVHGFMNKYRNATQDMDKAAVLNQLRRADGRPGEVIGDGARIRRLFDELHDYLVNDAGLPLGKIENYFPRVFSREKLIDNQERIIRHLMDTQRMQRGAAEGFFNSLISDEAETSAALRELENDPLSSQTPGFRNMRSRSLEDRFFDEFLEDNLDAVVSNYVNAAVKRGEYNRFMGHRSRTQRGWQPRGALKAILRNAEIQGATETDLKRMKQFVDANLGMLGRDFDRALPGARKTMAAVMAYQNMRVLMFTVFASLPDMVGPAIRTGNMREAFNTVRKNIGDIASNRSDLHEMARAWGIVSDQAIDHIMTEYVDNHHMPPQIRKWNDAFFKYTGLKSYTDFTRKMALAVGKDYIKSQARLVTEGQTERQRLRAEAALKELGLTRAQVNEWVNNGESVFMGSTNPTAADEAIAEALMQFVDESIMRPNASQRPIMASHPAAMLLFHLKGYMYAIYEVVIRRMAHNFKIADTPAQSAAAIAPAIMMLALTAVGLELRELLQYKIAGRPAPSDRQDGWDYTWNLVNRSGLLGPTELVFDFEGADKIGMTGVAAIGGPALSQFAGIVSRPPSQTVPKAIPIVGQIPWMRDGLRDITPL